MEGNVTEENAVEGKPFCCRTHSAQGKAVFAACDADLIGKVIKHGEVEFPVESSFYGGERAGAEEIVEMAKKAYTCNFVGKKVIDILVREGVIDRDSILLLGGEVPHVMTLHL